MNAKFDYTIVGCGITGAVIARHIAENGKKRVLIVDRRDHIGGNMYDYVDGHGILVHKYGPHIFHTYDRLIYELVTRYCDWSEYTLVCKTSMCGKVTPTPFNFQTIDDFYTEADGDNLKQCLRTAYPSVELVPVLDMLNNSNDTIRTFAEFLFEKDYRPYTSKQWGISPSEIDPSVLNRVPVRLSYKNGYFDDTYQMLPINGYTELFKNLLDHPLIELRLSETASTYFTIENNSIVYKCEEISGSRIVYTGPADELFLHKYGKLPYRSIRFDWIHDSETMGFQDAAIVAYPEADGFTRITEYNKLPLQTVAGTTYAVEYPLDYHSAKNYEPYYPILTESSQKQYAKYKSEAEKVDGLWLCGRLGDFKYYNMDQAIKRALDICEQLDGCF